MRLVDFVTLFAAVANISIGLFVLKKGFRRALYISFTSFSLITGLWALSNFFFSLSPSRFLLETQYAIGSIVTLSAFIWFVIFLEGSIRKLTTWLVSILGLLVFIAPYFGNLVVQQFTIVKEHSYNLELSSFFDYYSLIPISFFILLIVKIIKAFKASIGIRREQIRYIFGGAVGFGGVSILVSFILPYFKVQIVAPFDAQSSLIFVGFSLYAIIRHRLLDIRVVITRSVVYGILLALVTLSFVFITFLSGLVFGDTPSGRGVVSFVVATLIVFGLDPLKRLLSLVTDRVFFKARVNYAIVLQRLTEVISIELNKTRLIEQIQRVLREQLKLKSAVILLRDTGRTPFDRFEGTLDDQPSAPPVTIRSDGPLMTYVQQSKRAALLEALERKIEDTPEQKRGPLEASRQEFFDHSAALVAPVFSQNVNNAVVMLGQKLSGESFSDDDLRLLDVLGPQIGSAIQKANLFEQVRQFGERLQVKVREATSELKEQNVTLETLQRITQDITRTLDFNKVVQNIADAVSTELGFIGAILVFLDDDGRTLRARAITNTPITSKALKMLPRPFQEYATDITKPSTRNIAHDVIQTGDMRFTENMTDALSPPLPKLLVVAIQKLIGVRTMVLVPILSEEKVIGVIEVGAKRRQQEINDREIKAIQSMADQLGIVYRNLRLFSQIQKANRDLENANRHLQQLDQAKSEFVSIASHQLRTPMTGIMGYLSMMVDGDFGTIQPKHQEILKNLLEESQRMIRLINLFLNVSKIEAGKFTINRRELRLEQVINREVMEMSKAASDKGLKLRFRAPKEPLPTLVADGDKLQDVLLNLIDNALKYTSKGSVTVTAERSDDGITVHVADTGIGVKPKDISELFNKFVRASGVAQIHPDGSGLGLFIAKSIIEGHGGRIWVESAGEGQGSTFSFWVPLEGKEGITTLRGAL